MNLDLVNVIRLAVLMFLGTALVYSVTVPV